MADSTDSVQCQQQKYGEITIDLFNDIGTFFVDDDDIFIFVAEDANVALDNVRMAPIYNTTYESVEFAVMNGTVLIVDSEIDDGYDVGYNPEDCIVVLNERLFGDNGGISRLVVECGAFSNDVISILNVMDSAATSFVHHFSPSMIEMRSQTTSYFPGMDLKFNYSVTDRLGTVIDDALIQNTTIVLSTASFSSSVWFDHNGYCQICEEGVWLSDVSLDDDVGALYSVQLSMDNNRLVLDQNELTFNIIGCPAGFGADSSNFTCSVCEADTYNLQNGSLRECLSCDSVNNPGILC